MCLHVLYQNLEFHIILTRFVSLGIFIASLPMSFLTLADSVVDKEALGKDHLHYYPCQMLSIFCFRESNLIALSIFSYL